MQQQRKYAAAVHTYATLQTEHQLHLLCLFHYFQQVNTVLVEQDSTVPAEQLSGRTGQHCTQGAVPAKEDVLALTGHQAPTSTPIEMCLHSSKFDRYLQCVNYYHKP